MLAGGSTKERETTQCHPRVLKHLYLQRFGGPKPKLAFLGVLRCFGVPVKTRIWERVSPNASRGSTKQRETTQCHPRVLKHLYLQRFGGPKPKLAFLGVFGRPGVLVKIRISAQCPYMLAGEARKNAK